MKKESIASVLLRKKYAAIAVLFAAAYALLYATLAKPSWADYALWVQVSDYWALVLWAFSSLLVGIVAAGQVYLLERKRETFGIAAGGIASALAAIVAGVACGCSASIAFALLGSLGALAVLVVEWRWVIGVASIIVLLLALYMTQREIARGRDCKG